jgi:hypothetical protein
MCNFRLLDASQSDVARLVEAMLRAHDAVGRRSWSHPAEPTTEEWWQDVLSDPRARRRASRDRTARRTHHTLADEQYEVVTVACTKCGWHAAFPRRELIATHGLDAPMPDVLVHLARPDCDRRDTTWDRCGVRYARPIDG